MGRAWSQYAIRPPPQALLRKMDAAEVRVPHASARPALRQKAFHFAARSFT